MQILNNVAIFVACALNPFDIESKGYLENEEWMNNVTSGNYQKYYEEMYKAKSEI